MIMAKLDIMFSNSCQAKDQTARVGDDHSRKYHKRQSGEDVSGYQTCSRAMMPGKHGSTLFTARTASLMGGIADHAYCSSKHEVVAFNQAHGSRAGYIRGRSQLHIAMGGQNTSVEASFWLG